jgi:hypothetical protein
MAQGASADLTRRVSAIPEGGRPETSRQQTKSPAETINAGLKTFKKSDRLALCRLRPHPLDHVDDRQAHLGVGDL